MHPRSWWIRLLLAGYPRDYRRRHCDELAAAIRVCLARERAAGTGAVLTHLRLMLDAIGAAALVRRDRHRARRHSGNGDGLMQSLFYDLRHAVRLLARAPLFSALVVATLAVAIGANTTIFSIVNAVLLRPLPYKQPERLVLAYESVGTLEPFGFSAPDFVAFAERARSYEALAAFKNAEYELSGVERPERVTAAKISAPLLSVIGVQPALGRAFTAEEDSGRQPVAILSDALWRRTFSSDRAVVGKSVSLDRRPYTIVGVMPAGFTFPNRGPHMNNMPAAIYVPMSFTPGELRAFGSMYNISVIGRLKPGVTVEQANGEAAAIAHQLVADIYPAALREMGFSVTATARAINEEVVRKIRRVLVILLAAVGVLLLIACADIACVMLTRAAARTREMAIRTAVGANRSRVMRLMLLESGLLALAGGASGIALAWLTQRLLLTSTDVTLPRAQEVSLDGRVLAFTLAIAAATALLCGVIPAFDATRGDSAGVLKEAARSATASTRQRRLLSGLVTLQFACAIVLLAAGMLLIRSFTKVMSTDPGFNSDHVVSTAISLPARGYPDAASVRGFYGALLERIGALPGVTAAGGGTDLPLSVRDRRVFTIENPPAATMSLPHAIAIDSVMGRYFEALGVRIIRGRALQPSDSPAAEPVMVINETMARRFWINEDPVGQRIAWGGPKTHGPWMRIVGVVGDIKQAGLAAPTEPQAWQPWSQLPDGMIANNVTGIFRSIRLMVRTTVPPLSLVPAIREEVRRLDPALPVTGVMTLDEIVGASAASQRFNAVLLGGFAAVALLLAAVGIGGVLAMSVSRRTQEIGIRLALGARAGSVVGMVVGQGMTLVLVGLAIGLPAAFLATRLLRGLLFDIAPHDITSFAAASVLLCVVAAAACAAPALRASRVDPMRALRID